MQYDARDISSADLAELFRRSVNISSPTGNHHPRPMETTLVESRDIVPKAPPSVNYSISQHYTHSAHVVHTMDTDQTSANKFVESTPRGLSIYQILAQNNIPPSSLLRSQLTLFEQADEEQRVRLIQLWSISPPNMTRNEGQTPVKRICGYQTGALEQEKELPWVQQKGDIFQKPSQSIVDLTYDRSGYSGWFCGNSLEDAETYMTSGYEQLAQRDYEEQGRRTIPASLSTSAGLIFGDRYNHATDPIYQGQHNIGYQHHMFDHENQQQTPAEQIITILQSEDEEML